MCILHWGQFHWLRNQHEENKNKSMQKSAHTIDGSIAASARWDLMEWERIIINKQNQNQKLKQRTRKKKQLTC